MPPIEKSKVTLSLSEEALRLLASLVTERKRGEFVSGLIVAAYEARRQRGTHPQPAEIAERLRELAALVVALQSM